MRRYEDFAQRAVTALESYVGDVKSGSFPGPDETYHLSEEVAAELGVSPSTGAPSV